MAKPKDLKSRLKSSDRRRRRRPAPSAPQAPAPTSNTDVTELLVSAIVTERGCTDATVIAALRCSKSGAAPSHPDALRLYGVLQQIAERDDVDGRGFRNAIDGLLKLSAQHERGSEQVANPFVSYLALLTG